MAALQRERLVVILRRQEQRLPPVPDEARAPHVFLREVAGEPLEDDAERIQAHAALVRQLVELITVRATQVAVRRGDQDDFQLALAHAGLLSVSSVPTRPFASNSPTSRKRRSMWSRVPR